MYREKPLKDKYGNDLKVKKCFNKKDIQEAWRDYYGFIHYYPMSEELQDESLDIDTFCFSLGYTYVTGSRDNHGSYWRYSSWLNWEYS